MTSHHITSHHITRYDITSYHIIHYITNNYVTDTPNDDGYQPPVADSDLKSMRLNYIRFLNEGYRAEHGGSPGGTAPGSKTSTSGGASYMSPAVHQWLANGTSTTTTTRRRSRRAVGGGSTSAGGGGGGSDQFSRYARRRKKTCQRHEMYVDFEKIGWSGWIISPKGYNAYHCRGVCPFPLGQNQRPSNHATVQSIVHALKIGAETVDTPCCVPNKLYSISLLYFDDDENVILKQYDEMVAASCGCH